MSGWFELNLNIGNIMTAIFARKYDLMVAKYIVGHNTIAKLIRENSNARDFGISQELDYFDILQRISESLIFMTEREKLISLNGTGWKRIQCLITSILNIFSLIYVNYKYWNVG